MRIELCPDNPAADELLSPAKNDRSGIGVHYVDAILKPLRAGIVLPDGSKFSAKRRGLKVTLTYGTQKGEGLMRRLAVSSDPRLMLAAALQEAGEKLGSVRLTRAEGKLWLETKPSASST